LPSESVVFHAPLHLTSVPSTTLFRSPPREDAERAYRLLVDAMTETDRIAIANFVMRSKQYLAAVRPQDGVLVLETMYFADEVRADRKSTRLNFSHLSTS